VPTLDDFRKQAKDWLKEVRRQNPGPVKRLRLAYPNAPATPVLRDVQHALAREHGYENWRALTAAVEHQDAQAPRRVSDVRSMDTHADRVALFLQLACWNGDVHGRSDYALRESAALRLLHKHPEIAGDSLRAAVVCSNIVDVERHLAGRPTLANEKGGPWNWEPILYLCYGRLPLDVASDNAVAIARALLDRGADPNAYYMAGHALYGTLVGVAGEGEQEARPHPHREALYRLLLERGAELYDIQVLYNTHFSGDMLWWLRLTFEHAERTGRATDWHNPSWPMLDMGGYGSGARFVLDTAIERNNMDLAEWALTHGADPNAPPPSARQLRTTSLYDRAIRENRLAIAEMLVRHGANRTTSTLEGEEAFVAAILRLDRAEAERLVADHPEQLHSSAAMFAAASRDRADAIQLLLDLGTSVNVTDEQQRRPLHVAAANDARQAAMLLLARGADVDARETRWNAPAIGVAAHHGHAAMVDLLSEVIRDVWHLAYQGKVERLRVLLAEEPARAQELSVEGLTPLWWLPNDAARAVEVARLLLAHGADPAVRSKQGTTAADAARLRSLDEAADVIAAAAAGG
jgi:uncharacterized protein